MACSNFDRFIINDMYRSELCLLYPPHMIAITAIYLTLVLNDKTHDAIQAQSHAPNPALVLQQDFEILSLYTLWERYSDAAPESGLGVSATSGVSARDNVVTLAFLTQLLLRMREAHLADLAHPVSGQPMATNMRLGRTQAVG
ncbi:hypothetical protein F5148DRAFT_1286572 [Russula earlei]|uniref:Uncharacterized protein n=1 Tax=Russula earlei TaxID=71964 RepID=A0ACC0U3P7_9AGAM|nr:hypothetical protein F5148DRAFT_1286572 [Russula earlei]